jgi:hypothetical protein
MPYLPYFLLFSPSPLLSQVLLICGANISIRNKRNRLPIEEAKVEY